MDTMLLVVTGISVVVAAVSATMAWRLIRAERARTAARVAALAAAAGIDHATPGHIEDSAEATPAAQAVASSYEPAFLGTSAAAVSDSDVIVDAGTIFARPAVDSGSARRQSGLMAAAALFAVAVIGTGGLLFVSGRTPGANASPRPPLELVAMGHQRTDGVLSVSGFVRNPASGEAIDRVEAEVRVFDAAGLLTVSQTATIDLATLAPGQESPFVVALGGALTAARYRVSFKADGSIVPHVDRRTNAPAAVTADAR